MNLALFDFDGTLTTHETFGDFMRHAVTPRRRALGVPLFAPMLAGYKLGLVSGNRIRRHIIAAFGFRGCLPPTSMPPVNASSRNACPACCVPTPCGASPGTSRKATRWYWFRAASISTSHHGAGNTPWN